MLSIEKQIFLQRMIAINYMPINDAINLFNKIVTEVNKSTDDEASEISLPELKRVIKEINSEIKQEELQLVITICEATSKTHLALLSIGNNFINAMQLNQHPLEHNYWEKLMKEIITSDTKSLSRLDCLNLVAKYDLKMKLQDAEQFLNKCTSKGYLALQDGLYYLGGRTLTEFGKQFRNSYADFVQVCELCSELCCYGKTCLNCNKVMHCYCLDPALKNNNECPLCHVQWGNFDFEEQAVNGDNEESMDQNSSNQEEAERSMDVEEMSQRSRSTRSSQRKKKRAE